MPNFVAEQIIQDLEIRYFKTQCPIEKQMLQSLRRNVYGYPERVDLWFDDICSAEKYLKSKEFIDE